MIVSLLIGRSCCPSMVILQPSSNSLNLITIVESPETKVGLLESICGHMGLITMALMPGLTIGPPLDKEYAVDPVGEATISPSLLNVFIYWPLIETSIVTSFEEWDLNSTTSFNP